MVTRVGTAHATDFPQEIRYEIEMSQPPNTSFILISEDIGLESMSLLAKSTSHHTNYL